MRKTLLVCVQKRHPPNPHSCGNSGSEALVTKLRHALEKAGVAVEVEASYCMSLCAVGPNVRLLPEGKTWHRMDEGRVDEIVAYCQLQLDH